MDWSSLFPFSVWQCWWLAPVALLLDLWLGDPPLPWPHPVVFVGHLLNMLEGPARRYMDGGEVEDNRKMRGRVAGALALAFALGLVMLVVGLVLALVLAVPALQTVLALYVSWAGLAMGSLLETGGRVLHHVEHDSVAQGRTALSWLVSRDTSQMDRPLMRKTLADTLSENFTDAFVAPFFWLLVAGPVGLWGYKTVSTMDSMWGYLTSQWRWLGWAGARGDDCLAWLPGRIGIVMLWLTHHIHRLWRANNMPWTGSWPGFWVVARDARGMPSPNSGWPMAACAWLCHGRMAGPSVYFGELVNKPWLGPSDGAAWEAARLEVLLLLLRRGALCGGLVLWGALLCLGLS